MILRRLYHEHLAQASYLLGCAATKEAVVIDPHRDTNQYLDTAAREGLHIVAVTETHIHADFVSGASELASRTGSKLYLSHEGPEAWGYTYSKEVGALPLHSGDHFLIGNIRLDVLSTPGHTPEHVSFLVTDTAGANEPMGICTGDFLFVGDVGRPDLLEKAVGMKGTQEEAARSLLHSLQRLRNFPDYLQIWPGHGAGSACGKALGAVPQSTLGYEKRFNWAFSISEEDRFVREILAGQPEPPPYFAEMKRVNRHGPPLLHSLAQPQRLSADQMDRHLTAGAIVVDLRPADLYATGHVPGTINIPIQESFLTWSGWLLPYDRPLLLIGEEQDVAEAVRQMRLIGLDAIAGFWTPESITAWETSGHPLACIEQIDVEHLRELLQQGTTMLIDVRGPDEHAAGFIPTSRNIPLGSLMQYMDDIPTDRAVVIHCQGGTRSAIATSLLDAQGRTNIFNLSGGFQAWQMADALVESSQQSIVI